MNALPCYAERAAREYQRVQDQADNRAAAELDALEEMRGNKTCVDSFIADCYEQADVAGLVSLFLDYGMPLRSKTPSDDQLLTKYEDRRDAMTATFDAWARKRSPMTHTSPLQRWMEVQP